MPQPEGWPVGVTIINPKDSNPYAEYKVETVGNKTKCYIESVEGQPFSIRVSLNKNNPQSDVNGYQATCQLDGDSSESKLLGKLDKVYPSMHYKRKRVACGKWAPFEFGATQFTEEGESGKDFLSMLGSIVVKIHRVRFLNLTRRHKQYDTNAVAPKARQINEKAKKALLTHSVKYGKIEDAKESAYWYNCENIDPADSPMHIFEILYRSRAILEALDIVPSNAPAHGEEDDASSIASDEEENDEEVSAERIKQLKNELRELRKTVKREPDAPPEILDLTAPQAKKRKVVIDLTL